MLVEFLGGSRDGWTYKIQGGTKCVECVAAIEADGTLVRHEDASRSARLVIERYTQVDEYFVIDTWTMEQYVERIKRR